jgi:CBS domain-containing protein
MQVKEVMTANPACCTPETPLPEVARMMVDNDCGEIPVVENKQSKIPVGVVTDRDIVCRTIAKDKNPLDLTAADGMSKPIATVSPETSVEECCRIMQEKQIRRVPVVDANGAICGIVALADIALQSRSGVAGEVIKEVSEPGKSASATVR